MHMRPMCKCTEVAPSYDDVSVWTSDLLTLMIH